MAEANSNLAKIFREMSSIYQYLGGEDHFRALAYLKAARAVGSLQEDIGNYIKTGLINEIKGIGEGITEKIKEYVCTGRIQKFEELRKKVPFELLELQEINGFGPRSLRSIHDQLGISNVEELITALNDGRIKNMNGFGPRKVSNMLRGLKLHKAQETRMLLLDALEIGNRLVANLRNVEKVDQIELAGSIRRRKDSIGDIDILVACPANTRKKVMNQFTTSNYVKTVLSSGETKSSIILKDSGKQADLRIVDQGDWGAALLYFTGSKEHNLRLRTIAKSKGLKLNEYGLFRESDGHRLAGRNEQEVYQFLGFDWIPPELREDRREFEFAASHTLPDLINIGCIKGDLHVHSNWSDGLCSIAELAREALNKYQYDYIVVTDHSKSERMQGGIDEEGFVKQIALIEHENSVLNRDFIKCGAETEILADGRLDISDELLSKLDWVCASIDKGFSRNNTDRLLRAIENRWVSCIAHPTGRLIGMREPYTADWPRVFAAAAENGTAMEINAQPERMDLNDELVSAAREAGITLVINTDSYKLSHFAYISLGVSIARRGGCTANQILNSRSWKEVKDFVAKKRLR